MTREMREILEATGWTKEWEAKGEARAKAAWQTERSGWQEQKQKLQARIKTLETQLAGQSGGGASAGGPR